jgi:hypothetical protein
MSDDPFDKYKDEPSYFLKGESEESSLKRIDGRIHDLASNGSRRHLRRWFAMAAMVLFLIFAGRLLMSGDPEGAALAGSYFEVYPNYQTVSTRGADPDIRLIDAYQAYDRGEFGVAADIFKEKNILTPTDGLYHAIALQGLSEWKTSLQLLFRIRMELPEEYAIAGEWYLALALVAMERSEEAQPVLEKISAGHSVFTLKATELLQEIQ